MRIGRRRKAKGHQPEVDLSGPLEDLGVSHHHAVLMRQPAGDWALVDEESTNGTFLNDEADPVPAHQRLPLQDGDRVHLGAWTTLTIEREDVVPADSPDDDAPSRDTRSIARGRSAFSVALLGPLETVVAGQPASPTAPKEPPCSPSSRFGSGRA